MCGHTRDPVIYSKFHRNLFRGFGTPGGQNLAFPITLASRFYNSLYYRTSRDVTVFCWQYVEDLRANSGSMWDHYEVANKSHVDISNVGEYFITAIETLLLSQRRMHVKVSC